MTRKWGWWFFEVDHTNRSGYGDSLAEGVDTLNVVVAGGIIAAEMVKDRV